MFFFVSALTALYAAALSVAQVTVTVGGPSSNPFIFNPPNVTASNGTVVTFVFAGTPGNHSITQSSFASPCDPLAGGFDSGFVFVPPNNTADVPSWNLTITDDSNPIWFYCGQLMPTPHCTNGMVGSINAASSGNLTFSAFQQAAIALNGTLTPGAPVPNLTGIGANATAVPGPITANFSLAAAASGPTPSGSGIPPSAVVSGSSAPGASGSAGASVSGSGSAAPSSPSGGASGSSGAGINTVNALFVAGAAVLGALLL
ncbi:hypothetical protein BDY19DRAFT_514114 [Irpex rosettiformis]|uniref:Uncharacterized protein n=1 Tax=Irpex rosettiformis TaxID=378272 RepID=A0ACB8UES2_9APHY|nr:hypothetical protein BDY19DRAFT_514114 [Irpex rosettiformis]